MSKHQAALSLLDKLIAKLEANTGGEALLPEEKQILVAQPVSINKQDKSAPIPPISVDKNQVTEKQAGKKGKGDAKKQTSKAQPEKPKLPEGFDQQILIFAELDLRISEIVECWKHPQSTNLYCQKILVGKEVRQIASGLQQYVQLQNMKGKVIVMANLKPKSLGGFNSNGMVVCASCKDHKTVQLLVPEGTIGQRLYLEGFEEYFKSGEEFLPVIKKSKILEKAIEHFKTNNQGYVVWKGHKLRTKQGFIKSNIIDGNVS